MKQPVTLFNVLLILFPEPSIWHHKPLQIDSNVHSFLWKWTGCSILCTEASATEEV